MCVDVMSVSTCAHVYVRQETLFSVCIYVGAWGVRVGPWLLALPLAGVVKV